MEGDDHVVLSLGLGIGDSMRPTSNSYFSQALRQNRSCEGRNMPYVAAEARTLSEVETRDERPSPRRIDVNRIPLTNMDIREEEEEELVSSPNNSAVSSLSGGGKRCKRDGEDHDDEEGGRKKLRLSKDQSAILEERFKEHNTLNPKQKLALARQLNLRPRQVEVWFQNRRARTKLKQTEVDCEYLKRCCESLTEENRRLQRELLELRALKHSPQLCTRMPPTTLTMCPSCERVAMSNNRTGEVAVISPWQAANYNLDQLHVLRPQIRS